LFWKEIVVLCRTGWETGQPKVKVKTETETREIKLELLTGREPYLPPVIEKFPPPRDVCFGTNVNPVTATVLVP
jgi:hypothetical protein